MNKKEELTYPAFMDSYLCRKADDMARKIKRKQADVYRRRRRQRTKTRIFTTIWFLLMISLCAAMIVGW